MWIAVIFTGLEKEWHIQYQNLKLHWSTKSHPRMYENACYADKSKNCIWDCTISQKYWNTWSSSSKELKTHCKGWGKFLRLLQEGKKWKCGMKIQLSSQQHKPKTEMTDQGATEERRNHQRKLWATPHFKIT